VAWCWGQNTSGELGDGTKANALVPVRVQNLPAGAVTAIGAGYDNTCAIVGGEVHCWGSAAGGALGTGANADSTTPVKIEGLPAGAIAVGAGEGFACAQVGASAYCWGNNGSGQLGDGTTTSHKQPSAVVDAQGIVGDFATIVVEADHTCGIRTNGDPVCWGHNDDGAALGNAGVGGSSSRAVPVLDLPGKVERIRIGGWHGCATVSGALWCWGRGTSGELGNGGSANSATPVPVDGLGDSVTLFETAGGPDDGDATCAVRSGILSCWGNGLHGRLGNGGTASQSRPVQVTALPSEIVSLVGGDNHWCAHLANGEIRCWGQGNFGQLGDGDGVDRFTPVRVTGL
jgi:alpha-tubulin suppressor-like RCC1 family protein